MDPEEEAYIKGMGLIVEEAGIEGGEPDISTVENLLVNYPGFKNSQEAHEAFKQIPRFRDAKPEELDLMLNSYYVMDPKTKAWVPKQEKDIDRKSVDAYNSGKKIAEFATTARSIEDYAKPVVGAAHSAAKAAGTAMKKIGGIPDSAGLAENSNDDFYAMRSMVMEAVNKNDDGINLNAEESTDDATNQDSILQLLKEERQDKGNLKQSSVKSSYGKGGKSNVTSSEIDHTSKAKDLNDYQASNVEEDIGEEDNWTKELLADDDEKDKKIDNDQEDQKAGEIPTLRDNKDNSPVVSRFTDIPNLFKNFVKEEYPDDISMMSVAISAVDSETNSFAVIFDSFEKQGFGEKVANAFLDYVGAEAEEIEVLKFNSDDKNIYILQVFFYGVEIKEHGSDYDEIHNPYRKLNQYKAKQRQVSPSGKYYKAKTENKEKTFTDVITERYRRIFGN
jgi:predicted GNAT family acetyltransferase